MVQVFSSLFLISLISSSKYLLILGCSLLITVLSPVMRLIIFWKALVLCSILLNSTCSSCTSPSALLQNLDSRTAAGLTSLSESSRRSCFRMLAFSWKILYMTAWYLFVFCAWALFLSSSCLYFSLSASNCLVCCLRAQIWSNKYLGSGRGAISERLDLRSSDMPVTERALQSLFLLISVMLDFAGVRYSMSGDAVFFSVREFDSVSTSTLLRGFLQELNSVASGLEELLWQVGVYIFCKIVGAICKSSFVEENPRSLILLAREDAKGARKDGDNGDSSGAELYVYMELGVVVAYSQRLLLPSRSLSISFMQLRHRSLISISRSATLPSRYLLRVLSWSRLRLLYSCSAINLCLSIF